MLLNTSTSGVTESPFLPPFFHTLQITFIVPGFVRTEGEGPAPEIILYECLTDTSPRRDIRLPSHSPVHPGCHPGSPRLIPAQVDSNFITVMFCRSFRHHIQQEHRIATPGMMRWLRDTLTQGKIGTALVGIKRPAGAPTPAHTSWPKFPAPEHGKATVPYAVPGQKAHRPACCVTARRHGTSGHTGDCR